ncbi:MAG: sulfite reductase subunit alpha [Kiloniella sp.]|nr:sulfite reductase subunit alpha [Kiloniella sp.]
MPIKPILTIPDFMPLSAEQRAWLQGYYAGMAMQAEMSVSAGSGLSSFTVDVLVGTQTGNAEGLAEDMAMTLGAAGAQSRLHQLDDVELDDLATMENVLVITSTYGEGEMPDNAHLFWEALESETAPRLEAMSFSVLALGDTAYDEFCAAGKMIDKRFEQLGATRLVDRVDCDVDFEDLAAEWSENVMAQFGPLIAEAAPVAEGTAGAAAAVSGGHVSAKSKWTRKNPFPTQLSVNRRLSGAGSKKDIRHYEVALIGDDAPAYEAGDAVNVLPANDPALVELWLNRLEMKADSAVPGHDRPLADLMLRDWEIVTPTKDFVAMVAMKSGDSELAHVLEHNDKETLEDFLWNKDTLDLLIDFPQIALDLNEVATLFRPLQHRAYSISSSSKVYPESVHMTISTVRFRGNRRLHQGVASGYLAERVSETDALSVFMSPNKNFRVPEQGDTPIIMVGPGTGVAPFRAFLQERQATGAGGKNWLFFGDQTRADDYIYSEELEAMHTDGLLSRLDLAFSRDQADKVYVQHRMLEHGKALFDWLENGAHFYVCGDATRMARDVDEALHQIIAQQGGMDEDAARDYVNAMKKAKRYARDVY